MMAVVLSIVLAVSAVPQPQLKGVATWYAQAGPGHAAAGPKLRSMLGKSWRGKVVRVTAGGRTRRVVLDDWCQCYKGTARERVIDLSDEDFGALAPLSRGILTVIVKP